MKAYPYVGPEAIRTAARFDTPRYRVHDLETPFRWAVDQGMLAVHDVSIIFTYVVLPPGEMWLADRRSEHIACARGGKVLTAGEITFERERRGWEVAAVSNLSTGYCPESDSWSALRDTLIEAGFDPIDGFDPKYEFRQCPQCGQISVIKDDSYICPACESPLPQYWNIGLNGI